MDYIEDYKNNLENKSEEAEVLHPQRQKFSRRVYAGRGVDTDIIVASARAYMQALNRMLAAQNSHVASTVAIAAGD